ncbi:MAG TPA: hypothetical protein VFS67_33715 [Polyangiaceae bacterium]|nr:hypothetical protein [Polyangiaceae bacterium]
MRVRGYVRKDGTYVAPHYRSAPDGNFWNNWSTRGNVNPYTGKPGTRTQPGPSGTRIPSGSPSHTPLPSYPGESNPALSPGATTTAAQNLQSCVDGYSMLCKRELLTPERLRQVQVNDLRRNAQSCLDGYSMLCKRELLTPEQLRQVQANDLRRNLRSCLDGYSMLCKRQWLTPEELRLVEGAERVRAGGAP